MSRHLMGLFSFLLIWLLSTQAFGQTTTLKGQIFDCRDFQVIEYATISLYTSDSTYLDGTVTDEEGKFMLKNIKSKSVYLVAQFLGYESLIINSFNPFERPDLGRLSLSIHINQLDEVLVSGRSASDIHKLDK